jgi:hypothetical protein
VRDQCISVNHGLACETGTDHGNVLIAKEQRLAKYQGIQTFWAAKVASRLLVLALIAVFTVGFDHTYAWNNTGVYRSLTCGGAAYSLYHDNNGLVSGVLVANLFSDVPIIVVVSISTGSPGWRHGKSFTVPANRIVKIRFEGRYPEAGVIISCSY